MKQQTHRQQLFQVRLVGVIFRKPDEETRDNSLQMSRQVRPRQQKGEEEEGPGVLISTACRKDKRMTSASVKGLAESYKQLSPEEKAHFKMIGALATENHRTCGETLPTMSRRSRFARGRSVQQSLPENDGRPVLEPSDTPLCKAAYEGSSHKLLARRGAVR